jgi:hypothetical protein
MEERKRQTPDGKSFVITHNVKGKSIDSWVDQFKQNEKFRLRKRRKDGVYLNHEILSWHRDDTKHLTEEKVRDMVQQYIKLRGSNGMYVATVHTDRDHVHVHICSSGLQYRTGKSMRMSRAEYADLKKNAQQYHIEKFPELSHSVVQHGRKAKGRISDKELQFKLRTGKLSQREAVKLAAESCYKKSNSPDDFYSRLKTQGLETYIRGGKVYGITSDKRNYRFITFGIDIEKFHEKEIKLNRDLSIVRRQKNQTIQRER